MCSTSLKVIIEQLLLVRELDGRNIDFSCAQEGAGVRGKYNLT